MRVVVVVVVGTSPNMRSIPLIMEVHHGTLCGTELAATLMDSAERARMASNSFRIYIPNSLSRLPNALAMPARKELNPA